MQGRNGICLIAPVQNHFVKLTFVVASDHTKLVTETPKTEKADAKLTMYTNPFGSR